MTSSRGDGAPMGNASPWYLVDPRRSAAGDVWRFRPVAVLQGAIVLLLVGQLGRIPVLSTGSSEAPILVNDFCVMAVLAAGLITALVSRSFRVDRVGGIALLFAAVGGISAVLAVPRFGLAGFDLLVSLAYLARWIVYFGVYLVVINVVRADDIMPVWRTIERTILAFSAFGIVQAIFIPHFAQVIYPESRVFVDWDEQRHRLVSTILDPNLAGALIMIVLLIQLAQLAAGFRVPYWKPMFLFVALTATLSRSSFLGLLVGGALILAVRGVSRQMLRFGALIVVAILAALPKLIPWAQGYAKLSVDASALTRVSAWLRAIRIFADNPVIGVGFNTYGFVQELYGYTRSGLSSYSVDGGLLFIAVMTGVVGLFLYLGMLGLLMRRCRRVWRDRASRPEFQALATGIAASIVAICVNSFFVNSILTTFVMEPLWVLWGLASVMASLIVRVVPARPLAQLVGFGAAS